LITIAGIGLFQTGEPENDILPGTAFENLPTGYCCPLCDAPIEAFVKIDKGKLLLC
jgi:rubredoxin